MAGKDLRNPTTGETAQETVDRMAGGTKQHYAATPPPNTGPTAKPPGPKTSPWGPGGRNFGSPIDAPILTGGNK